MEKCFVCNKEVTTTIIDCAEVCMCPYCHSTSTVYSNGVEVFTFILHGIQYSLYNSDQVTQASRGLDDICLYEYAEDLNTLKLMKKVRKINI